MSIRRKIAVGAALTLAAVSTTVVMASPASAAMNVGSNCPSGWVCLYSGPNATGTGWALQSAHADSNLGISPEINSFNDQMVSWKNNSGIQYCWFKNDRYGGGRFPMPSYGNGRVVNLQVLELRTASSLAPC